MSGSILLPLLVLGQAAASPASAASAASTTVGSSSGATGFMIHPSVWALALLVFGFTFSVIWMGIRHNRFQRELEHRERMQALQMGRLLPSDEPWWSPMKLAMGMGVGVPIGSLLLAIGASEKLAIPGIWPAATFIGCAGVVGGTVLALTHMTQNAALTHQSKPHIPYDELEAHV